MVVRAELSVVQTIAVRQPERIAELEPFHIWTTESVRRNRIDFRPRHELTAIVVSARALAVPLTVPLLPEYAGCRSWVDLVDVPELCAAADPCTTMRPCGRSLSRFDRRRLNEAPGGLSP